MCTLTTGVGRSGCLKEKPCIEHNLEPCELGIFLDHSVVYRSHSPCYPRIALSLFAARGLTDDLDLQLSIPFISTTGTSSFQDAQLFMKWLPLKTAVGNGKITFGAAIGGSVPMVKYETETGNSIGQQASSITPMGVLQYTSGSGWFTSIVGGQQMVSAPTPDALIGTFRLGHASEKHYVEAYMDVQEA